MEQHSAGAAICGIGTAVPEHRFSQDDAARQLEQAFAEQPDAMRWMKRVLRQCGVKTRYTCEPRLLNSSDASDTYRFLPSTDVPPPNTEERMHIYKRESVPLALRAAREALEDANTAPDQITHLITVSCTGQFLPGLDAEVCWQLGLSPTVNRIPLTYLGCAAGLKAIGLAHDLCLGAQSAKILVVCVELCTLHIQPSSRREDLFAASFFGDGASACVVGAASSSGRKGSFRLGSGHSSLLPGTAKAMTWDVGNYGFKLYLSPDIPKLLGASLLSEICRLPGGDAPPELWAIHPGGRGIVDAIQAVCGLTDDQTRFSRNVLLQYGNLSSATILFVMHAMREELSLAGAGPKSGLALAFGPGLTAQLQTLTYVPPAYQSEVLEHGA
ncbi:type III polyketide synthase [Paenibacillus xerothermodurans]|uniref:Type III polyketide synthase n=1 Tax=Paenibacillus xerothermodurans TaxID=1977292 RepID=A0A2W1N711_PAEXE|nr:type III polyketide synthase [Paenibacillus xerothermodurans]